STNYLTEKPDTDRLAGDWHVTEMAPSEVRADEPSLARVVGACALFLLVLGSAMILAYTFGRSTIFDLVFGFMGRFIASICIILGAGGLLFHAARDGDFQVRRAYMLLGYGLQLAGIVASLIPQTQQVEGQAARQIGAFFLPYGALGLSLGLLF